MRLIQIQSANLPAFNLPHHYLEPWYQLLCHKGKSLFWHGHFQLPSARESANGEKETTKVSHESTLDVQTNIVKERSICSRKWPVSNICIAQRFLGHSSMSLFNVGNTDNTGSWVHCRKYHSVPNHPMVHEDGMDNMNNLFRLTVKYSNSNQLDIVSHLPLCYLWCSCQLLS